MFDLLQLYYFLKISVHVGVCRTEAKVDWSPDAGVSVKLLATARLGFPLSALPACTQLEEQRTVCRALGWEHSLVILQDATASDRPQALH